jgi:hypothetical protein
VLTLQAKAQAIADQYHTQTPPDHGGRFSAIANVDTVATLLEAFRSGLNDRDCCLAAGIHPRTLQRWHEVAEHDPQSAHAAFVDELKRVRAEGKLRRLQRIERAADDPKYWASNAWILERTDPEQFALRKDDASVPQIVVHAEGATKVTIGVVSPSTFAPVVTNQDTANSLTGNAFALPLSPIIGATLTNTEACQAPTEVEPAIEIPAVESEGGPTPSPLGAGGQAAIAPVKGKSRPAQKEKKGHGAG